MESPHLAVWKSKIVGGKNPHTLEKMFDMSYVINCVQSCGSQKSHLNFIRRKYLHRNCCYSCICYSDKVL